MAATLSVGGGRSRTIAAINVTPLVDVCLVLLIILMVSSTYIVSQTLKVQLPKAKSTDGQAENPVKVELLRDGTVRFNDQKTTADDVGERLKAEVAKNADVNVVVSADKDVHHGDVVRILDFCKLAGVTKFAINVMQGSE